MRPERKKLEEAVRKINEELKKTGLGKVQQPKEDCGETVLGNCGWKAMVQTGMCFICQNRDKNS